MSTNEIICLSSEDDDDTQDKRKNNKIMNNTKNGTTSNVRNKRKLVSPITVDIPKPKRVELDSVDKKNVVDTDNDEVIEVIGIVTKKEQSSKSSQSSKSEMNEEDDDVIISNAGTSESKPLLVVKEKHPVHATNGRQDIFSMFLSQCLLRDKSPDMRKIVEKLKRKYEQLDPSYAHSEEFEGLLNTKRNALMHENGQVYKHIADVNKIMKLRKLRKINEPSSSEDIEGKEDNEDSDKIRKRNAKIRAIEKTMIIVEKRIKKYEESEVDLDDDSNSNFLITERYKKRMVELHAKWCEFTGNHSDAGRSYLRPIHLKLTGIVTVDQAINSFINTKIKNKNNPKNKRPVNNLVFPDYIDIFNLIHAHNVAQKLGMDTRAEKSTAKDAFVKLGEYLKHERQKDFYDTFSTMYEQALDPATKHDELKKKLRENQELGKKKLNAIFDEYSKKQDEANMKGDTHENDVESDDNDEDNDDDEDEDVDEDEDEDVEEEEEEEEEEEAKEEVEEITEGTQKNNNMSPHISNINISNSDKSSDDETIIIDEGKKKANSSEIALHEKSMINKINKLEVTGKKEVKETSATSSLDINSPVLQKNNINKVPSSNSEVKVNNDRKISTSPIPENTTNTITNDVQATSDEMIIESIKAENSEKSSNTKDCEEEKPLLKLRSFAKPPGFWQNSQECKTEESNEKIKTNKNPNFIEIIELDNTDNRPNDLNKKILKSEITKNVIKKNTITNQNSNIQPKKYTKIPLISKDKDVKIFRRLITIPVVKISKNTPPSIPTAKQKLITRGAPEIHAQSSHIPLSAIEIRKHKASRSIPCTLEEKKSIGASSAVRLTKLKTTIINPKSSQTLCINPVAANVQMMAKSTTPPQNSNINSPVIVKTAKVKCFELKSPNQKIINPIVKQQQWNNVNMVATSKISEYNKNTSKPAKSSDLVSR